MDHFNLVLLSFTVLTLLFIFFHKHLSNFKGKNLPPGRFGLPFIGETLEFISYGRNGHPEKFFFDRVAKYSSELFKTSILAEPTAVFCGAAGNKFLFSNENKLVTVWWPDSFNKVFPLTLQNSSTQEEARKMKKILPVFLKPEALQRYIGIMDLIAGRHLEMEWEGKEEVEVFPLAKRFTLWLACRLFMNLEDPNHVAKFADHFNAITTGLFSVPIDLPGTRLNEAKHAANFIRKELCEIIKRRKIELGEGNGSPAHDVLSHMLLLTDEDGKHMNELNIADKILGLLISGHDTASVACTFIVKYLAELPHIYEGVYEEQMEIARWKAPGELLNWDDLQKMKFSWNVACEVLRLAPPSQGTFREAITNFMFNGFSIPKGWKLYWSTHSTHKSPDYFPDPDKFDPTRFDGKGPAPYTFVPFGGGPRMCPGKEFARLEILVFMHNLFKRFRWEKVLPDEKVVVDPMPVPEKGLPVRLYPHKA